LAPLGGLSLVAGIAVVDALRALGVASAALKWPNDIVIAGRKLGGVLVEGSGEAAGMARAVIGLGLNVRMPSGVSEGIEQPWTDLATAMSPPPLRNVLAVQLLDHLLPACALFDRVGLAPFLPRYAGYDALRDCTVVVHVGDVRHQGRALGVAQDGALRVEIDAVERRFHAGEVSVRAQ